MDTYTSEESIEETFIANHVVLTIDSGGFGDPSKKCGEALPGADEDGANPGPEEEDMQDELHPAEQLDLAPANRNVHPGSCQGFLLLEFVAPQYERPQQVDQPSASPPEQPQSQAESVPEGTGGTTSRDDPIIQEPDTSDDEILADSENESVDTFLDPENQEDATIEEPPEVMSEAGHISSDELDLKELDDEIVAIELACSLQEDTMKKTDSELLNQAESEFQASNSASGQESAPVCEASISVQHQLPGYLSHNVDPATVDPAGFERYTQQHENDVQLDPGRDNPIPRHYYLHGQQEDEAIASDPENPTASAMRPNRRKYSKGKSQERDLK